MENLSPDNIEKWMSRYYENPEPQRVPEAIRALRELGQLDRDSALETIASFLSFIFRAHPDKIEAWLSPFDDLTEQETVTIANALWFSNMNEAKEYLVTLSQSAEGEMKEVFTSLLSEEPPVIDEIPIMAPAVLDMLWAAFAATGDDSPVIRIISALPNVNAPKESEEYAIGEAAVWSLKSNAANHTRVMDISVSQLDEQPLEAASILRAVIDEAKET